MNYITQSLIDDLALTFILISELKDDLKNSNYIESHYASIFNSLSLRKLINFSQGKKLSFEFIFAIQNSLNKKNANDYTINLFQNAIMFLEDNKNINSYDLDHELLPMFEAFIKGELMLKNKDKTEYVIKSFKLSKLLGDLNEDSFKGFSKFLMQKRADFIR